jgi:23S rRNA maturation mini-RNase III
MTKRAPRLPTAFPTTLASLALTSWETIFRRSMMMVQGTCSAAEYQRMVTEKVVATQQSLWAMACGGSHDAMLRPYVTRARANVKRLRRGS